MFSVFQGLSQANLTSRRMAKRELEAEIRRGQAAQADLLSAYRSLEERIREHAEKLARANEDLKREADRCHDAERRFEAISESVDFGAWIYNLDGTAQMVSSSYQRLIGATLETVKEKPWFEFLHCEDVARVRAEWERVTGAGEKWDCEFRIVGSDGEVRHLLSRGAPLEGEKNGKGTLYVGFQFDVTDRARLRDELMTLKGELEQTVQTKTEQLQQANQQLLLDLAERTKTEVALRDSESQLRAIFEHSLDAKVLLDDERRVLDANESAVNLFGYSRAALRGLRWDSLLAADWVPGIEERWERFCREGGKRGEVNVRRADGNSRLVAFSSRANILPGRHLVILKDITDHREAEESLRLLSHRLMRLQDDERRRIARELHDSTGQSLAALRMHLDTIAAANPALPAKAQKSLKDATEICRTCSNEIRTISYLLHPPLLDEVGLLPALEWYIAGFNERSGVRVTYEISEPLANLTRELNTALFRIIQEALANTHKHAESKDASIRLHRCQGSVVLEIRDTGKGIDPARLNSRPGVKGLGVGITGMKERVRQLGGTLAIEAANPGTLVRAIFPIKEEVDGNSQSAGS